MNYYNKTKEDVLKEVNSSYGGLTTKISKDRQKKYGSNELTIKKKKPLFMVFINQFNDILIIILIISAIISIFTDSIESAIVIVIVLFINALIGTIQYYKAEKTLESLKKLSSPIVKVIRNGKIIEIAASSLTIGDICCVSVGDVVCSDGRILESDGLEVNESSITGESQNIEKNSEKINGEKMLAERSNMLYTSSSVVKGSGKYVVTAIGMNTEIGKITTLINKETKQKSPLQISLDQFSKYLALIIIFICVVVFGINVYRHINFIDSLMFSVSLAVAAIPEALSAIVTIVLAIGTRELANNKAVMKDIKSVETLGAVSYIFSDKTGTITTGQLDIHSFYKYNQVSNSINNPEFKNAVVYCNSIDNEICDDQIEKCLYQYLKSINIDILTFKKDKTIHTLNFDSQRKIMSVSVDNVLYVKGSPEKIINLCNYYQNGTSKYYLDDLTRLQIENQLDNYTNKGFRVIAYGSKGIFKDIHTYADENNFTFLGLIAFYDPPRERVKDAIELCKSAGITPVMITGDNQNTAKFIAQNVGMFSDGDEILTGIQMQQMTNEELFKVIEKVKVYARVTPTDKIRIVETMQKKDKIVAMTGDGVNDAPALKKANVGVSMGLKGTEVAKDASTVILTDDNFYTIVNAVGIGRKIYANIQNAVRFLIAGNAAGILIVLITTFLLLPIPFAPVHLLFINLITDSLPAIAIGLEKADINYLKQKPRKLNSKILSKKVLLKTIIESLLITGVVIYAYFLGLRINQYSAQTNSFLTLSLARLFYSLNCRKDSSIFKQKNDNPLLLMSILVGVGLVIAVCFIPFMKNLFFVCDLSLLDFLYLLFLSLLPTILIQSFYVFKK